MTTATKLSAEGRRLLSIRKRNARQALDAYAQITGQHGEDDETLLSDLVADCIHLMGRDSVNSGAHWGVEHYEAEARGEE
jgi:hypothetical protein